MKKRTKIVIALSVACVGTLILGACTSGSPYGDLYDRDYVATVRYDANGGVFGSTSGINNVVTYSAKDVQKGIKLLEPGDSRYGQESVITTASRNGYVLAGWYAAKEPRIENGVRVDEYGNPYEVNENGEPIRHVTVKEEGKDPVEEVEVIPESELACVYSDKWDFDNDVFQVSNPERPKEGEYTLTLYAAWVPNFVYKAYAMDGNEWKEVASTSFDPIIEAQYADISVPSLNESTGAYDYGRFPVYEKHTFEAAYEDSDRTQKVEETLAHGGTIDYERGIAIDPVKDVYVDWKDGVWYEISTAQQFINNASLDGCYNIHADLDFEGLLWNTEMATSAAGFSGKILGVGGVKKFSNISFEQANNQNIYGGIFARLVEGADIEDISFENAEYILGAGSRAATGGYFGLFAGSIADNVTVKNVSVTGQILIGNVYPNYSSYNIGLLTGAKGDSGITYDIDCGVYDYMLGTNYYYSCIVTLHSDDTITLTANSDTSVKPDVRHED